MLIYFWVKKMNHKYINLKTFDIVDDIIEIDEDIALTISILNKKGYYTKFSCSGHSKDPRLFELYHKNNHENLNNKELGYVVNENNKGYDIMMPYTYTLVYIMFVEDYNFDYLPFGFIKNNEFSQCFIEKQIEYYNKEKRKNDISKEIKDANDALLNWAKSLPYNK